MTPVSLRVAAVATVALFAAAACGGSSSGGNASNPPAAASTSASAPAAAAGAQITISSFAFGNPLTVKPGQKVSVQNNDSAGHTVTADDGKSFDVPVNANGTASFTAPSNPGTYKFYCAIHPYMHGTLVVKA